MWRFPLSGSLTRDGLIGFAGSLVNGGGWQGDMLREKTVVAADGYCGMSRQCMLNEIACPDVVSSDVVPGPECLGTRWLASTT